MRSNVSSLALTSVQLGCDFDSRFFIVVFDTGTPTERPDSETATLCQPVMPVGDGLGGRFVRVDCTELGKRHGHIAAVPADQHQHIVGTGIFWCQPEDFSCFSFAEWRNWFGRDASGREGKLDLFLQVVVPAKSLLFRSIGVNDDFVMDSFFTNTVRL